MNSIANMYGLFSYLDLKKKGVKTQQALRPMIFAGIAPEAAPYTGVALAQRTRQQVLKKSSAGQAVVRPIALTATTSPPEVTNSDSLEALKEATAQLSEDVKKLQGYVRKNCSPSKAK